MSYNNNKLIGALDTNNKIVVIPSKREHKLKPITYKCGECGMEFEANKVYGYVCSNQYCPVFPVVTCLSW